MALLAGGSQSQGYPVPTADARFAASRLMPHCASILRCRFAARAGPQQRAEGASVCSGTGMGPESQFGSEAPLIGQTENGGATAPVAAPS